MTATLTLVAKPGALTPAHIARVREALAAADIITPSAPDWLSEGEACDIALPAHLAAGIGECVRKALGDAPVDAVLQQTEERRKRLLVADMDSTIITCECVDELADAVGLKARVSAITERAMRGEIAFEPALEERIALLEGLRVDALERVFEERVHLMSGARTLVATMAAHGAATLLVSGGFTFFTSRVAALAGFTHHQGNVLEIADGKLTGRVRKPILGRDAKLQALLGEAARLGLPLTASLAVGDGANDLDMIKRAGLGVAFHAKPVVTTAAPAAIRYSDLTALLYLQGYRRQEFTQS